MLISSRGDSMSFVHVSLLALGVASPFERERGGFAAGDLNQRMGFKLLTSILPCLRGEARESDVMLIPETDNQPTRRYGRCHHGTQPSLNIQ
jgi:hypothetical protein